MAFLAIVFVGRAAAVRLPGPCPLLTVPRAYDSLLPGAQNTVHRRLPTPTDCGFSCAVPLARRNFPYASFRVWAKYKIGLPENSPLLCGSFEHPELSVFESSESKNHRGTPCPVLPRAHAAHGPQFAPPDAASPDFSCSHFTDLAEKLQQAAPGLAGFCGKRTAGTGATGHGSRRFPQGRPGPPGKCRTNCAATACRRIC